MVWRARAYSVIYHTSYKRVCIITHSREEINLWNLSGWKYERRLNVVYPNRLKKIQWPFRGRLDYSSSFYLFFLFFVHEEFNSYRPLIITHCMRGTVVGGVRLYDHFDVIDNDVILKFGYARRSSYIDSRVVISRDSVYEIRTRLAPTIASTIGLGRTAFTRVNITARQEIKPVPTDSRG